MNDIKRYDISYSERYGFDKEEDQNGEYVEWEDVEPLLSDRDRRISALEAMLSKVIDNVSYWHIDYEAEAIALLAAQQQADPVMQVSSEVSKQISKRGRDAIMAAERLVTLDESKTVSLEDMESRFGVEPATHSEEGLPMQVTDGGRNPLYEGLFDGETEQNRLERIMAAKDAEIARLRDQRDRYCELWNRAANQTAPQPARQVGGDWPKLEKPAKVGGGLFSIGVSARLVVEAAQRQYEYDVTPEKEAERIAKAADFLGSLHGARKAVGDEKRAFNYSVLHDFASKHGLDYNELCATARAALAPAAVAVDSSASLINALEQVRTMVGNDEYADDVIGFINRSIYNRARLNRRAIPVGLLERICKDYTGRENWDALEPDRLAAAAELRALLGKS